MILGSAVVILLIVCLILILRLYKDKLKKCCCKTGNDCEMCCSDINNRMSDINLHTI